MTRDGIGLLAGVTGGAVKLALDQLTFAAGISAVNEVGIFSRILFPATGATPVLTWIIYLVGTAVIGWLVARLLDKPYLGSYLPSGLLLGAILWAAMNIIFITLGITPTWAMGVSSLVVNLVTHLILGVIITYPLYKYSLKELETR